jgi:hypothetical protein
MTLNGKKILKRVDVALSSQLFKMEVRKIYL